MAGWIKKATAHAHGQFRAKAEHAGMSTGEFADKHAGDSGKLGKQARLAKTLIGMHADGGMVGDQMAGAGMGGGMGAPPMGGGMAMTPPDAEQMPAAPQRPPVHRPPSRAERMYHSKKVMRGRHG